jgi:pSer/pThr/pTyr-binding forkhead associated (FHA) protein
MSATAGVGGAGRSSGGRLLDSAPDMGALAAVERFLERLFEGQSARIFRTGLRPIQVQRRIERAMETHRVRDGGRTIVPHRLVVRLAADDLTALRAATPGLAAILADSALAYARAHAYTLLGRPSVTLRADPLVVVGEIEVDAPASAAAVPASAAAGAGVAVRPARDSSADPASAAGPDAWGAVAADPPPSPVTAPRDPTAVFVVPTAEGPRATIREIRPDRSSRTIAFEGRPLTIGRASDNGLVLRDGRASRHHARIDVRRGSLVLTDLGSTNGSWVNDRRVESIALGEGDQVRVGLTTLIIEAVEAAPRAGHDRHPAAAAGPAPSTTGIPDGHVAH